MQASIPASNPWAFVGGHETQELSTPPPVADLDQPQASPAPVTPGLVTFKFFCLLLSLTRDLPGDALVLLG